MTSTTPQRPFSEACENNKDPILHVLTRCFAETCDVLEIGSGTGQHAVHFARHLPHLHWQPSDLSLNHAGIQSWIEYSQLRNIAAPIELDVDKQPWQVGEYDAVFTANTLHIMAWRQIENLFSGLKNVMREGSILAIYGPFNYGGKYTSPSNRRFDQWLREQNPYSAIRDFESVEALAKASGLQRREDNAMPANNRLLVWQKL